MTPLFSFVLKPRFNKQRALLAALALGAAPASADTATRSQFLMGTVCEITAHGPEAGKAIEAAFEAIRRVDRSLSLFKNDSELSLANRRAALEPVPCSNDLFESLHVANEVYRFSDGAFDPTFVPGKPTLGYKHVVLHPNDKSVEYTEPNLRVNLDGVGKGYALDAAAAALKASGASAALLNFGGQLLAQGRPPGQPHWVVEIAGTKLLLRVVDRSVSTSSQAEQPSHLVDPRTGKAVAKKSAVTVVMKDGAHADAWSTALFVLGVKKAPKGFLGCAIETEKDKVLAQTPSCDVYLAEPKAPRVRTIKTPKELLP